MLNREELLTRLAIWVSLAGYGVGAALYWTARGRRQWDVWARSAWTVGCVALLLHIAFALHFYHAWQQSSVWRETARQTAEVTGLYWGGAVFFNYALMLAWVADTFWGTTGKFVGEYLSARLCRPMCGWSMTSRGGSAICWGCAPYFGGIAPE